jgi:hypothetical protein
MSMAAKVAALRQFFGVTEADLRTAISKMNEGMGMVGEGPLPTQVDKLVAETGVTTAPAAPVAASDASTSSLGTAPSANPRAIVPAAAGKKRKPIASNEQTLFSLLPEAKKLKTSSLELAKQRHLAAMGEDYEPEVEDMRTFRSELEGASSSPASIAIHRCRFCPRTFQGASALRFHEKCHSDSTQPMDLAPPPPPEPVVALRILLSPAGECTGCEILLNGQTLSELSAEEAAAAERAEALRKVRDVERNRRTRQREAEEAGEQGEHRCGSGKRVQYSAKEQAEMVEIVNRIHDNPEIVSKGKAWADKAINPKFYGVPFSNTSKWRKPDEHRRILRAASKAHASSLLRIDTVSRKKGKYDAMERELHALFKRRRARGRKASARWLSHTAKHLLKQSDPAAAVNFQAGDSWRRRFRARFNISIRRKTNCKNTTWEETKPVLQRYFRGLRRRVTLSAEELAAYAVAPAAVAPAEPYASFDDVDMAIKPLSEGVSLWCDDYPNTAEGNAALDKVLSQPKHAAKLARFAATPCEEFDTFPRRVVQRAKLLVSDAANTIAPAAATATAAVPADRRKYGRYLPWQRLNVDQVPLPFVNDMEVTYETTGATRVVINQLGPALSKRQATGQVCFRPEPPPPPPTDAPAEAHRKYRENLMEQPPPTIIFRGKGNISQAERDAYPDGLVVLWQDKAWVDRPTACKWAEEGYKKMIDADVAAGVADDSTRYLLFQDNLDAQCKDRNPAYTEYLDCECKTDDHKVPPGKTDQVQPVDRGKGRQIKIYMGQEEDKWLEDDDNLTKWEDNRLTASDRRILIGTWFFRACMRAAAGTAKRKYFDHSGALMTADGTDDDLIKLEGVPPGETFTFMDAPVAEATGEVEALEEDEPDVAPAQEEGDDDEMALDDEDEVDEEDVPPAPCEPPPGFAFVSSPPSAAALAFCKEAVADADALVGRSILFHWAGIGWHVGTITRRNYDGRRKRGGTISNFYVHYQVDDDEGAAVLSLEAYGGDDESSWLLLEPVAE